MTGVLHEINVRKHILARLWGPGGGWKGQISLNINYKVNFKRFYTKRCLCSHKIQKVLETNSNSTCWKYKVWPSRQMVSFFPNTLIKKHVVEQSPTSRRSVADQSQISRRLITGGLTLLLTRRRSVADRSRTKCKTITQCVATRMPTHWDWSVT